MLSSCDYLVDKNDISWLLRKVLGHTTLISYKMLVTDSQFLVPYNPSQIYFLYTFLV